MLSARRLFRSSPPECGELWLVVDSLGEDDNRKAILVKDLHLVEAAHMCDKRIISGDDEARRTFAGLIDQWTDLSAFLWARMDENSCSKAAIDWVERNAPDNDSLRLTYVESRG